MKHTDARVDAVRHFNRFYTRHVGAIGEGYLGSDFSLTESRVLFELANRDRPTASEIAEALGLDRGQLSRILKAFKRRGLIASEEGDDRRRAHLHLTGPGKKAFAPLDRGAKRIIGEMLRGMTDDKARRLTDAMQLIRETLNDPLATHSSTAEAAAKGDPRAEPFTLRPHRPGDMGWVVHRHGVIYWREWGYDETMEALVARVTADFIDNFKPERERCWIAERDGEIIGSIFVVEKSKTVAKLRLLLVEPTARGLGLGGRLVDEVLRFSKDAGYKKVVLWTQSELVAARKIYQAKGFRLVAEEKHHSFGKDLVAETWECSLG